MQKARSFPLLHLLTILAALLIWKVTLSACAQIQKLLSTEFRVGLFARTRIVFLAHTGGLSTPTWSPGPLRSFWARFWSAAVFNEPFRPVTGGLDVCKPPGFCCSWHLAVYGWPITQRQAPSLRPDLALWQ